MKTGNSWVKSKLFLQLKADSVKKSSRGLRSHCGCDLKLLTADFYRRAPHQRTSGQAGQHHGSRHFVHVHLLLWFSGRARNVFNITMNLSLICVIHPIQNLTITRSQQLVNINEQNNFLKSSIFSPSFEMLFHSYIHMTIDKTRFCNSVKDLPNFQGIISHMALTGQVIVLNQHGCMYKDVYLKIWVGYRQS